MRSQEQSKSTWTCQKSHFVWKFTGKNAHGHVRRAILWKFTGKKAQSWVTGTTFWREVEAHFTRPILYGNLQEKCRSRISRPPVCVEIYRKKRTWTCQKSHFVWKFTGKMREATFAARTLCGNLQEKTRMDIAQGPFCVEIYREKCGAPQSPPGPTRAPFYSYRTNPFSVATLFGKKCQMTWTLEVWPAHVNPLNLMKRMLPLGHGPQYSLDPNGASARGVLIVVPSQRPTCSLAPFHISWKWTRPAVIRCHQRCLENPAFLSISIHFYQFFLSMSIHFSPCLSISINFYPFLSIQLSCCTLFPSETSQRWPRFSRWQPSDEGHLSTAGGGGWYLRVQRCPGRFGARETGEKLWKMVIYGGFTHWKWWFIGALPMNMVIYSGFSPIEIGDL